MFGTKTIEVPSLIHKINIDRIFIFTKIIWENSLFWKSKINKSLSLKK
jgi:hypothetical protein